MKALVLTSFPAAAMGAVGDAMVEAFCTNIERLEPGSQVDVCRLADDEAVPEPPLPYDLVIFTGGTFDLLAPEPLPAWVGRAMRLVHALAADATGRTKLLGVCWGHQAIQMALGGQLVVMPEGPRIGIETLHLTPQGRDFFGTTSLRLHKFHKRQVKARAPGFAELAPDNEILQSASGRMLSFQAHPEMTAAVSRGLLAADTQGLYRAPRRPDPRVALDEHVDGAHDGAVAWRGIVRWVRS